MKCSGRFSPFPRSLQALPPFPAPCSLLSLRSLKRQHKTHSPPLKNTRFRHFRVVDMIALSSTPTIRFPTAIPPASRAVEGGVLKRAAREKEERGGRATTRGPQAGNTSGGRRHGITQSGAAGGQAGGRGRLGRLLRLLALLLVVLENDSHRHAELHRVADLGRQSWLVWGEGRGGTVWRQAGRLVSTRACVSPA